MCWCKDEPIVSSAPNTDTLPELGGKGAGVYGLSSDHFTTDTLDELRKEISKILIKWSMPSRQSAINELVTLFTEHSKQARIDELKNVTKFISNSKYDTHDTAVELSFWLKNRLAQLKRNKGEDNATH